MSSTRERRNERVKGIEPSCAAWEAAVLPLNYTREEIFDFRFAIADCNPNNFARRVAVACAVLSAYSGRIQTSPLRQRPVQHEKAANGYHCHEITSSELV